MEERMSVTKMRVFRKTNGVWRTNELKIAQVLFLNDRQNQKKSMKIVLRTKKSESDYLVTRTNIVYCGVQNKMYRPQQTS